MPLSQNFLLIENSTPAFTPDANVLMVKVVYADDINIQSWYKNDLEQKENILYKVELKINLSMAHNLNPP